MPPRRKQTPLELVHVLGLAYAKTVADRDKAIRRAHAEGHSLRQIAEAAGVSHTSVANILARA